MRVGAVIAAAGLSTRMEKFKQLMKLGDMSFAERVVRSFQQAGVRDIVMVTGYRAAELERQLRGLGIVFLMNEDYAATQMFDSAKIGLSYIRDKCSRVFFCPVDVPLFRAETLRLELSRTEDLIFPICHNRLGHPILFDASLIPHILAYKGAGGLKGALDSIKGGTTCYLPVQDEGSIIDADTVQDLQYLVDLQNAHLLRTEVHVALAGTKPFFDLNTRLLLMQIDEFGSVRKACQKMRISYSKGWKIVHDLESELGCTVIERKAGGKNGGGGRVTERGRRLISLYELLEQNVSLAAMEEFNRIFSSSDLFPNSSRERTK